MHLAWPAVVGRLWLATPAGGLAALVLGPCEVAARVSGGQPVRVMRVAVLPWVR